MAAQCADGGGRWNDDNTCSTAAEVLAEMEMACTDAGGRWNDDNTCTDAAGLMVEATTAAAGTKETAIAAEAATAAADDAGLGGTGTAASGEGSYSMTIDPDGATVEIAIEGATGEDPTKFMQAMDLGGGRTMHVHAMEADDDGNVVEEVVIVSEDRDAPTPVAFAEFEAMDGTTPQALNARDLDENVDADEDGTATNDFTALTVDQTSSDVLALVMSAAFAPGSGSQTDLTFAFDDATTEDDDEAFETAGTYNGAMGTYRCDGTANCTVTLDEDGMITAMSAGWVFTPADDAMSPQPDYDYLHYGFWLKKTTDSDGVVMYNEVETFAGSAIAASGAVTTVTGKATYSGGATGVYVKNVYNDDGTLGMATSGHFNADASLMAYFGQVNDDQTTPEGTIAPNLLNTLTGTIDNFQLSGGEENKWSVALSGDIDDSAGTASGTAMGNVEGKNGSYSATFHGDVTAAADGTVPKPGSVVGEFNADFSNGSVAGGFGARMDEE